MRSLATRLFPTLAAGILITIGGCADVPTAVVQPEMDAQFTTVRTTKAKGEAASVLIGTAGGVIEAGGHRLVFPAGALARPTMIRMEPMSGYAGVVFAPHGLVFPANAQPVLTLSLQGAAVSGGSALAIGYHEEGRITEVFEAAMTDGGNGLSTAIPHFSGYIMIEK